MKIRLPSCSQNLLLLISSLAISLLVFFMLGEVLLRFTGKLQTPPYPPVTHRPELYQKYEPYGYRLLPSRSTTYLYPRKNSRKLSLVSNSAGFRSSREFDEPDGRVRIVVVGDSLVFGDGVEEHERFTNILEKMEPNWRVDNLGMTGFGPDLMLRALEVVGLSPVPDVVVFSMYTDDFRRVRPHYVGAGFEIPRFKLKSERLISISYPKPRFWDQFRIIWAIRHVYWNYTNAIFDLNEAIFDRFLKLAELLSFKPVIIFLPGTSDTTNDRKRRTWLRNYAENSSTSYLDLTEPIHIAGKQTFIRNNWHYNRNGHHIVAEKLRALLAGMNVANATRDRHL